MQKCLRAVKIQHLDKSSTCPPPRHSLNPSHLENWELPCSVTWWLGQCDEENENAHPFLVVLVGNDSLDDSQVLRSYIDIFRMPVYHPRTPIVASPPSAPNAA